MECHFTLYRTQANKYIRHGVLKRRLRRATRGITGQVAVLSWPLHGSCITGGWLSSVLLEVLDRWKNANDIIQMQTLIWLLNELLQFTCEITVFHESFRKLSSLDLR